MRTLLNWFDDRTGYRSLLHEALYENIPGGSRWRYVWGSTLVFTFMIQMITGIFLWMCYSPSSRSAWESVYYIQYEMQGGWLLRGLHHFTAQAMIVLMALHLMQVIIDGAYKAPREVNFWLGLILLQIVLGLALTGYLLPWDQKGFWATQVATNLMGLIPYIGDDIQKLLIGGPTYGHTTLTRFFALHAGVLPGLLIGALVVHIAVFRRHGIKSANPTAKPDAAFWPDQVLKDAVACLAVLAVILLFVVKGALVGDHAGEPLGAYMGAELFAPADPSVPYDAARPEWYFLFLFQFLKIEFYEGAPEIIGAIIVPGALMGVLFLMPLLGRWRLGHGFNVAFLAALGIGIGVLTYQAKRDDSLKPAYQLAVHDAELTRHRAIELAQSPTGIPESGAVSLLRSDPKTKGPELFTRHCASCHAHTPADGRNAADDDRRAIPSREPSAPDLYGFGTASWIGSLLDPEQVAGPRIFGTTSHNEGEMVDYVQTYLDTAEEDAEWTTEEIQQVIAALVAEANLANNPMKAADIEAGRAMLQDADRCGMCHQFGDENEDGEAPNLTGYASRQWMIDFISNPEHENFYGDNNDRMPGYAKNQDDPRSNVLTAKEIELMVDWLRGTWYRAASADEQN